MEWTRIEKKWHEMALRLQSAKGACQADASAAPVPKTGKKSAERDARLPSGDAPSGPTDAQLFRQLA